MLKSIILAGALLIAPAAQARDWYSVDKTQGLCSVFNFDGMTSPAQIMSWSNENGAEVNYTQLFSHHGNIMGYEVNIDAHDGKPFSLVFFSQESDCEKFLKAGQDDGIFIKPNMN